MNDLNVCPARTGTDASHCWHDDGRMLLTYPTQVTQICCYCNKRQTIIIGAATPKDSHGPYLPSSSTAIPFDQFIEVRG